MKTVAFVPIKLNSERTPGKNIKPFFDGNTLVQMIERTLAQVPELDERYVFCSDDRITDYLVPGFRFLRRPAFLDTAQATPQDIIREFSKLVPAEIYMVSHATSPFVKPQRFSDCLRAVQSGEHDSAFTCEKIQRLLWQDGRPMNFQAESVPRTQDLVPMFAEVSAAYVFRRDMFERLNRRIGDTPYLCEVSGIECVDIDYPEDFAIADALYRELIAHGGKAHE